nr:hypothetical protein BaRGS_019359 [Batillaria attramentaria]
MLSCNPLISLNSYSCYETHFTVSKYCDKKTMWRVVVVVVVVLVVVVDWCTVNNTVYSQQHGNQWPQWLTDTLRSIDSVHGYMVQYDDAENLFIFRNNASCYLVPAVSERWDEVVHDVVTLHKFTVRLQT